MSSPTIPNVTLASGVVIPQVGFGVFRVDDEDAARVVTDALATGYRSIDTAAVYGNEAGVGAAVAASDLPREELFITSKVWNDAQGRTETRQALEQSLERLGLDHLDLYLIHWPVPSKDRYVETWEVLQELRAEGLTRAVGVSNFQVHHLERVIDEVGVVPDLNQIELHPELPQAELRAFHAERGIATEAWSPLAAGQLVEHPTLAAIGERHGCTPAQVMLRWHLQLGNVIIPKSSNPTRMAENLGLFDFALERDEVAQIEALATGRRIGPDPDVFG